MYIVSHDHYISLLSLPQSECMGELIYWAKYVRLHSVRCWYPLSLSSVLDLFLFDLLPLGPKHWLLTGLKLLYYFALEFCTFLKWHTHSDFSTSLIVWFVLLLCQLSKMFVKIHKICVKPTRHSKYMLHVYVMAN